MLTVDAGRPGGPDSWRRLGRRGAFWASASVLALALWSSGAPSVLYPIYAEQWALSPAVVTAVFATYQLALVVVLPLLGSLSDQIGRRLVMIWGVALIAASAVIFALAPNVTFLFVGRVLQGAGTGLAIGAASASLVQNNISGNPRFANSLATIATSTGLTLALVLSGAFAQFAPLPLFWSYIVLLVLAVAAVAALAATPDDRPADARRWRPQALRLAPGLRRTFTIATLSVCLAYSVGALFLSLGAYMIRQFTQTDDTLVIGALLGCSSATIGVTALLLTRVPAHTCVWVGVSLTVVSLALMAAVATSGSIVLFLAWCLVGGVAYSFAFTGGLGLINRAAAEHHRGAALSLLYLFAYLLQAATAIGAGALATANGLDVAVSIAAAILTGLCVAVLALMAYDARTTRSDSPEHRSRVPAGRTAPP
ncbi:MFS transporter [Polymorphospora lycopeni]|uniref:MFS transporter n=1 Tax=Polymorphospora lycopeni TaxID=3140240 RepID=A0ABV5CWW3_9ACTN